MEREEQETKEQEDFGTDYESFAKDETPDTDPAGDEPEDKPEDDPEPEGGQDDPPAEPFADVPEEDLPKAKSWQGRLKAEEERIRAEREELRRMREEFEAKPADSPKAPQDEPKPQQVELVEFDINLDEDDDLKEWAEEFPEQASAVTKLLKKAHQAGQQTILQQVGQEIGPIKDRFQKDTEQAQRETLNKHFSALREAHDDLDDFLPATEQAPNRGGKRQDLETWIREQPSYIQPALSETLAKGSTQAVIDMLSDYKQARGQARRKTADPREAGAAAVPSRGGRRPSTRGAPDKDDFEGSYEEFTK